MQRKVYLGETWDKGQNIIKTKVGGRKSTAKGTQEKGRSQDQSCPKVVIVWYY